MLDITSQWVKEEASHLIIIFYFLSSIVDPLNLFISLFSLHRIWNIMNMDCSLVTIKSYYDTATTYTGIQNDRTKSNPTYWKLKKYTLHSIMVPRLITKTMRD